MNYVINNQLLRKFLSIIFFLLLYRIGTYIPLPGVNIQVLYNLIQDQSQGVIGMFNVLTGGAISRMSIFSLNIMPFITASIIIQIFIISSKDISDLLKNGEKGKTRMSQYTKYLSFLLALFQGYIISYSMESQHISYNGINLLQTTGIIFRIVNVLTLTTGTVIVIWFSEKISEKGVSNGTSLIIFTGIVSGLLPSIFQLLEMLKTNILSFQFLLLPFIFLLFIIYTIVFVENSLRKVSIFFPKKQVRNKLFVNKVNFLPIKINVSGLMPSIFANSLLLFPISLLSNNSSTNYLSNFFISYLSHGKPLFIILQSILIFFFSFFYSGVTFNTLEVSNNLRKSGAIITGIRPGKQTSDYLYFILMRITVIAALYIVFICSIPELIFLHLKLPLYLGGTSLLIITLVVLDLISYIQSYCTTMGYSTLMQNFSIMTRKQ